jgi:hypothetical protein
MKKRSETGHEVNDSNFGRIINCAENWGTKYNPSNPDLQIANLKLFKQDMRAKLTTLYGLLAIWIPAVNDRVMLFKPLGKFITRVVNALRASNASAEIMANVETIARKLEGTRAKPKLQTLPSTPGEVTDKMIKQISASQMGFDNRTGHFEELIALLSNVPEYAPNETDLTTATLTALLTDMRNKNDSVTTNFLAVDNARIERDDLFYHNPTKNGAELAIKIKAYAKSIFGGRSPQYKQVCRYTFRRPG